MREWDIGIFADHKFMDLVQIIHCFGSDINFFITKFHKLQRKKIYIFNFFKRIKKMLLKTTMDLFFYYFNIIWNLGVI